MVFREVSMIEVREALRAWMAGKSERAVAAQAGVDRKTGKRYVTAAVAAGLSREGGEEQLTDELVGQVVSVVRPVRPDGHGQGWAELEARREQIAEWVEGGVPVVKIGILLGRQGVVVAERTLHRFAAGRCGGKKVTTPVDDGAPGAAPTTPGSGSSAPWPVLRVRTRTTASRQSMSSSRSRVTSLARSPSRAMHKMIARSRSPRGDDESSEAISCSNRAGSRCRGRPARRCGTIGTASSIRSERRPAARRNRKNDRSAEAASSTVPAW